MLQDHLYIIINENQEMSWKEFCGQGRPALSQLHFCEARGSPRVPHASYNFPHLHLWEPRENPRAVSVPGNPTWAGEKVVGEGGLRILCALGKPPLSSPLNTQSFTTFCLEVLGTNLIMYFIAASISHKKSRTGQILYDSSYMGYLE